MANNCTEIDFPNLRQRLEEAAQTGNIDALYSLLRKNPYLLNAIDNAPFADTPLHTAASAGSTHFAMEILNLKPSFGKKLNPDGFSPVDLAFQSQKTQTIKHLVRFCPELIRVRSRKGFTPLHYVAEKVDYCCLLELFLKWCPQCIGDLTNQAETALHIAVRNKNIKTFKLLLGFILKKKNRDQYLNAVDDNGDTVLHIAARLNDFEVVRLLIQKAKVRVDIENFHDKRAVDIAEDRKIKEILRQKDTVRKLIPKKVSLVRRIFSPPPPEITWTTEEVNISLVIAVLIATATYQAVLSPPGGISSGSDDSKTKDDIRGKVQMQEPAFAAFITLNTLAFEFSMLMIGFLLERVRQNMVLKFALLTLFTGYGVSMKIISPKSCQLLGIALPMVAACWFYTDSIAAAICYCCRWFCRTSSES